MFLGVSVSLTGRVSPFLPTLASVPQICCWETRNKRGVSPPLPWMLGRPGYRCAHLSISVAALPAEDSLAAWLGNQCIPSPSQVQMWPQLTFLFSCLLIPLHAPSAPYALCIFPPSCIHFYHPFHLECWSLTLAWHLLISLSSFGLPSQNQQLPPYHPYGAEPLPCCVPVPGASWALGKHLQPA